MGSHLFGICQRALECNRRSIATDTVSSSNDGGLLSSIINNQSIVLNSRNEFWKNWEEGLNAMCGEVEGCVGAAELVEALAKTGLPMAIATSSRYAGVEKKRARYEI